MRPKIGVIGAGIMGTSHGKSVHFCQKIGLIDCDFVALAETDVDRRESYAAKAGVAWTTDDAHALIASPDINTVYICTPTHNHKELALDVLARGKALFCEKPLAFNAADAREIRDAAKAAGVTHQVGLVMRFSPVVTVLRDLLRDEALGRAMTAVMVDDQYFPIQGHYQSTWRGDVALVGAGTLLEHAIHDIDILVSYFGRVKRVYGVTRHFFEHEGVEDLSSEVLEFESGAVVSHVSIWHNLLHRGSSRRMQVICENGQFSWEDDDWKGAIRGETNADQKFEIASDDVTARYIQSAGVSEERLAHALGAPYVGQDYLLEDYAFLKAVTEDRPSFPDFDTAVYAHEVVDAIYESARTSMPVELSGSIAIARTAAGQENA